MPLNGTDFMNDPLGTMFSPFTEFFEDAVGVGAFFYVFLIIVLSIGLYMKTKDLTYTSMFATIAFAFFSAGSFIGGIPEIGMLFAIFTGLGIASIAINIILQIRR